MKDNKRSYFTLRQAAEPGVLELYLYGEVQPDYYEMDGWYDIRRVTSETSADFFRKALDQYPGAKEIRVFINSPGGSVIEGTAIYNQLRRHPARVIVQVDGFAISIASVIAMAGDEVIMPRNTCLYLHNMGMGVFGNAAELRKAADELDTLMEANRQAYLVKAGGKLPEEQLIQWLEQETWLTAEQCVAVGLADRFAEKDADLVAAAAQLDVEKLPQPQQAMIGRTLAASLHKPVPAAEPDPDPEPEPQPEPEPPPEPAPEPDAKPTIAQLFAQMSG